MFSFVSVIFMFILLSFIIWRESNFLIHLVIGGLPSCLWLDIIINNSKMNILTHAFLCSSCISVGLCLDMNFTGPDVPWPTMLNTVSTQFYGFLSLLSPINVSILRLRVTPISDGCVAVAQSFSALRILCNVTTPLFIVLTTCGCLSCNLDINRWHMYCKIAYILGDILSFSWSLWVNGSY